MKQINSLEDSTPPLTMAAIVRRRAEAIKHNSECETDEQRHNQILPSLGTSTIVASDSGVFMSTSDIDRTHSVSASTHQLAAVEEYTEPPTGLKSTYVLGEENDDDEEEEEDIIELDQENSKTERKLGNKRTCQSLPDVNSPRALSTAVVTTCDSSSDIVVAPTMDEGLATRPCDTGGAKAKQQRSSAIPASGTALLQSKKLVDPSLLQAFSIDPKLINKYDGLEHTLYYIDENGSPKLRDKFSVQQQLAEEKKRRKRERKMEKYGVDADAVTPQCTCFSFSRLSRKFREMYRPQEVSYTDTKVIGNGSFGVVFQATLCDTGELVAIKKVLQDKRFKLYMYQLFRSLAYIHSLGICHRDIKPQNLLLDPETAVLKLCDFGSAKQLLHGEPNVSYICSRYYRAPELIFGAINYTTKIDVWSAGCVLAELLLGQPIFPGDSGVDQLVEIIKVLGTPTREQIKEMNPNYTEFKFPQIKSHPWQKVFRARTPPDAIALVSRLLEYTPGTRITPIQACAHPFFNELREGNKQLPNGREFPPLFNFTEQELAIQPSLNLILRPRNPNDAKAGQSSSSADGGAGASGGNGAGGSSNNNNGGSSNSGTSAADGGSQAQGQDGGSGSSQPAGGAGSQSGAGADDIPTAQSGGVPGVDSSSSQGALASAATSTMG
ncbi:hypothetical protein quinque_000757 [Culex quinquefasciatus]